MTVFVVGVAVAVVVIVLLRFYHDLSRVYRGMAMFCHYYLSLWALHVYSAHGSERFEQQYFPTSHNFIAGITTHIDIEWLSVCRSHGIHTWYTVRGNQVIRSCVLESTGTDARHTRTQERDPNVNTIFHTASGVVFLAFDIVRSVFRRPFAWKHCLRCCAHRNIFVFYKHKYTELKQFIESVTRY